MLVNGRMERDLDAREIHRLGLNDNILVGFIGNQQGESTLDLHSLSSIQFSEYTSKLSRLASLVIVVARTSSILIVTGDWAIYE